MFKIIDGHNIHLNDIVVQLKAIKDFPATVNIYDRVIILSDKDQMWALLHGLEVGYYLAEEYEENHKTK